MFSPDRPHTRIDALTRQRRERGMTLLELLVGIAIGLLVIAAAIGTLAVSRGAAGTVSDVSQLQQQAAFALRVIGLQLRQAGALEPVQALPGSGRFGFNDFTGVSVAGTDGAAGAPDTLTVGNQTSSLPSLQVDCVNSGLTGFANNPSTFAVNAANQLTCEGRVVPNAQPVISNVADFQVSYRVNMGTTAAPTFRLLTASQMTTAEHWRHVRAIEICLDLQGSENIPDAGSTYVNCQGTATARSGRTHFVSRNVFDLRKQDVLEVALP